MAKKFDIPKQSFPSVADAYNSLIGIDNTERVVNLPLSQLDEIDEQPFPVNEDKVDQIADSIENVGVIEPIIVVKNGDRYSILSGRHRFRACQKLGKTEIPCHIKETDDTTARYILIATNTDRNNEYSPIVYARAYAEQIELMKKLGKKSVVNAISEQNGINRKQIYRYLRLNYLIPELQKWVEDKILTIEAAVELSFLSDEKQLAIVEHINNLGIGDSVVSKHFKVYITKNIRNIGNELSDEEFLKNIDMILFGKFGQKKEEPVIEPEKPVSENMGLEATKADNNETVIEAENPVSENMGLEATKTDNVETLNDPENQISENMELKAPKANNDEPVTEPEKSVSENMGLEAPKTQDTDNKDEEPTIEIKEEVTNDSTAKITFEEIVKGYIMLALRSQGIEPLKDTIDSILEIYSKKEAAELYRKGQ